MFVYFIKIYFFFACSPAFEIVMHIILFFLIFHQFNPNEISKIWCMYIVVESFFNQPNCFQAEWSVELSAAGLLVHVH